MAIDVLILQPLVNNFYLISIRSVVVVVGIVLTGSTAFLAIDFAIAWVFIAFVADIADTDYNPDISDLWMVMLDWNYAVTQWVIC